MRLIAISPGDGRDLRPGLDRLADAGWPLVLIREPGLDRKALRDVVAYARSLHLIVRISTKSPHAADVARELECGLHLPADGTPPVGFAWGRSCHSADEVKQAFATGAAWCFLSPIWPPTSKPDDARPPLGLDAWLAAAGRRRVYALGGVTPERHHEILDRGGYGSAVLGTVFDDPVSVLRTWTS